jgi:hypothetical protein
MQASLPTRPTACIITLRVTANLGHKPKKTVDHFIVNHYNGFFG